MTNNDWDIVLKEEYTKPYFQELITKVNELYQNKIIYPPKEDIFKALKRTSYKDTKVVIVGQDPYHGENEANGLSFSVNENVKIPPSLRNIFKELSTDLNINRTKTDLTDWADQGVLLLNSILTVEKDHAASHKDLGWSTFTDTIIKKLNEREEPVIFLLWGNFAISKSKLITNKKHYIITSPHPSPLSAYQGFFGSKPFSKINNILKKLEKKEIEW